MGFAFDYGGPYCCEWVETGIKIIKLGLDTLTSCSPKQGTGWVAEMWHYLPRYWFLIGPEWSMCSVFLLLIYVPLCWWGAVQHRVAGENLLNISINSNISCIMGLTWMIKVLCWSLFNSLSIDIRFVDFIYSRFFLFHQRSWKERSSNFISCSGTIN